MGRELVTLEIDSIIRKNIVPPKPIYILTILQSLETSRTSDYSLTSYGHCYQCLITDALRKANILASDLGTCINYLTHLANEIYVLEKSSITPKELSYFQAKYSANFMIESHDRVVRKLVESKILKYGGDDLYFGYKYIFYFYVAKYVSDNITEENSKEVLSSLCDKIHTEKHANILIFVTHHSKSSAILEEILLHASVIFDDNDAAHLAVEDFSHIKDVLSALPKTVIEQRNVSEEKRKRLEHRDKIDRPTADDSDQLEEDKSSEMTEQSLADINRSVRILEVIGQVLRNRHGDLGKPELRELIGSGFGAGLRLLDFYIKLHMEVEDEIVEIVSDLIRNHSSLDDASIAKEARITYVKLLYSISFAILRKISFSMGSINLLPLFDEVAQTNRNSASTQILNMAIQLEFGNQIPFKLIDKLRNEHKSNFVVIKLIQDIVVQHLYLHHVKQVDKQKLSSMLGIPIQAQLRLESQARAKMQRKQ